MPTLSLPWGQEKIELELPPAWRLVGVLEPAHLPGVPDAYAEAQRSLNDPVGSPRLCELARRASRLPW